MKTDRRRIQGFTLVEVVVALLLTALAMLAIAPLFVGGLKNNAVGWDYSSLNELAKKKIEELLQVGFNDPRVVVTAGTTVTIDGTVVKGKLFRDTNPNSVTVNGKTYSYPYELVYVVQDYSLNDIPVSGAPLPAKATDDGDASWSGGSPARYITVYAASSRRSLQGSAYSSAGLLSSASSGKQVRMSAVKTN
jgi:prepilin-type N-terminal cleavage/methylation domain-containing protein